MSYQLMVGGVTEGLLLDEFKHGTFEALINKAFESGITNESEKEAMNKIGHSQNLIHAKNIIGDLLIENYQWK